MRKCCWWLKIHCPDAIVSIEDDMGFVVMGGGEVRARCGLLGKSQSKYPTTQWPGEYEPRAASCSDAIFMDRSTACAALFGVVDHRQHTIAHRTFVPAG